MIEATSGMNTDGLSLNGVSTGQTPATYFAPPDRDDPAEICAKVLVCEQTPLLQKALDALPEMAMILNYNRQIIAANKACIALLNTTLGNIIAKRPGEAVGCIRAKEGPNGCGTALHCSACGAVNAILESQSTQTQVSRECRVQIKTNADVVSLDLKFSASPFDLENERFILAVVEDISQEKRLAVLQRAFFHDVLNTAGCIQGYMQFLESDSAEDYEARQRLVYLTDQLIEEIQSQRDLLQAESNNLQIQVEPVNPRKLLEELRFQYVKHPTAKDRLIELDPGWDVMIHTDRHLLLRVLGNMLKNALEATAQGGIVTLNCLDNGNFVTFTVHNAEVMPEKVQLQIFQRSFSTKASSGRGIGTYSMKLFGERYLGGTIDFISKIPDGTTFRLTIPKNPPSATPGERE
jgi:signal transduction histidine kinase